MTQSSTLQHDWTPEGRKALADIRSLGVGAGPLLRDIGEHKRRAIVLSFARAPYGESSHTGEPPHSHSGSLAQSITYNAAGTLLEVGSADQRARLLNEGGTVKAKDKKLAVPVHPKSYGKRPREFANLSLIPREGKGPLLAQTSPQGRSITPLFVLLESVTIEARPFLFWTRADEDYILRAIGREFERS